MHNEEELVLTLYENGWSCIIGKVIKLLRKVYELCQTNYKLK